MKIFGKNLLLIIIISIIFLTKGFAEETEETQIYINAQILNNCNVSYQIVNNAPFTLSRIEMTVTAYDKYESVISTAKTLNKLIRRNRHIKDGVSFYNFGNALTCNDISRIELSVTKCYINEYDFTTPECMESIVINPNLVPLSSKQPSTKNELTITQLNFEEYNNKCKIYYKFINNTPKYPVSYHFELKFIDIYDGFGGKVEAGFVEVPPKSSNTKAVFAPIPCNEIKDIKFKSKDCATYENGRYGYCPVSVKLVP